MGFADMVDGPWKVVGDNAQAEAWAREWAMMTINSRHIQQKYHIVKHMVKAGWFQSGRARWWNRLTEGSQSQDALPPAESQKR